MGPDAMILVFWMLNYNNYNFKKAGTIIMPFFADEKTEAQRDQYLFNVSDIS